MVTFYCIDKIIYSPNISVMQRSWAWWNVYIFVLVLKIPDVYSYMLLCCNWRVFRSNDPLINYMHTFISFLHADDLPIRGFIGHLEEVSILPHNHRTYLWTHLHFTFEYNGDQVGTNWTIPCNFNALPMMLHVQCNLDCPDLVYLDPRLSGLAGDQKMHY